MRHPSKPQPRPVPILASVDVRPARWLRRTHPPTRPILAPNSHVEGQPSRFPRRSTTSSSGPSLCTRTAWQSSTSPISLPRRFRNPGRPWCQKRVQRGKRLHFPEPAREADCPGARRACVGPDRLHVGHHGVAQGCRADRRARWTNTLIMGWQFGVNVRDVPDVGGVPHRTRQDGNRQKFILWR